MSYNIKLLPLLLTICFIQELSGQSALFIQNGVRLTIESDATLTVSGNLRANDSGDTSSIINQGVLEVTGNWVNDGTGLLNDYNATGTVEMEGTLAQTIQGSSQFYDLSINNSNGVTINSGVNLINHELTIVDGILTTNDSLTLVANASRTGRIGPITSGGVANDVIIEAYVENSPFDFKFLTIPVQNATLAQWSDDFIMTGFPGSQFPTFNFNSIYFYDETELGNRNARYDSATNITDVVAMGVGVQAYTGGGVFKIDAKGPIYTGTLNLPVTFTDDPAQPNTEDGWNLVGNPYPSTIDWDASPTDLVKTNMNNAIYIYQSSTSTYQSYINGVGTNGGSRYIPSSQAFFLQTTSASPLLRLTEQAKVANEISYIEGSKSGDFLRLRISDTNNRDEIVVRYNKLATSGFDANWDAVKILGSPSNPSITAIHDSIHYSILSLPVDTMKQVIFIKTQVPTDGMYELEVSQLPSQANCMFIEDLFTGRVESLRDSVKFHFLLDDSTTVPRFALHASRVINYDFNLPKCFGDTTLVSLQSDSSFSTIVRRTVSGTIGSITDSNIVDTVLPLVNGIYFFDASYSGCSNQLDTLSISSPKQLQINAFSNADSGNTSGMAWVTVSGGVPPYSYIWNDSLTQTSDTAFSLTSGKYTVLVLDSNACSEEVSVTVNNLVVGLETVNDLNLKVYPNPFNDYLFIDNNKGNKLEYVITDILGKVVESGISNERKKMINVNRLASGIYFLHLNGDELHSTVKIQKLK